MKYLNKSFVVTGEGSKKAIQLYRENWEKTFGKKAVK